MSSLPLRFFGRAVNSVLRRAGLLVVRTHTLDQLQASASSSSAMEGRLAALEQRLGEDTIQNVIRYAIKAHWRTLDLIDQATGADNPSSCPLCGCSSGEFREVVSECRFMGGRLLRHQCPQCDVIFGPQKMLALDEEMLDLDYRNLYRVYSEGDSTASTIRTFHLLKPRKDGVYLDFGCGGAWSKAIQRLRAEGWNVYGFEPSAPASSEFVFSRWEEIESRQWDGILSHNVLEHLFDPAATTRRLGQILNPDGRLVHATACFDYRYEYSHYHVFFFTGRSPEFLAERAGMRIEHMVRDGEFIACILGSGARPAISA